MPKVQTYTEQVNVRFDSVTLAMVDDLAAWGELERDRAATIRDAVRVAHLVAVRRRKREAARQDGLQTQAARVSAAALGAGSQVKVRQPRRVRAKV